MKTIRHSFCLAFLLIFSRACLYAQTDRIGKTAIGISFSYSPDSSHILIGAAEQRSTLSAGFEFSRNLKTTDHIEFEYMAQIDPYYQEADPTIVGAEYTMNNTTYTINNAPIRTVLVNHTPIGTICDGTCVFLYPVYGKKEMIHAVSLKPLGFRILFNTASRFKPLVSMSAGILTSSATMPIDGADKINYLFDFGPGLQIQLPHHDALYFEYLYSHYSNASSAEFNPGVDQLSARVTYKRYF